MKDKKILILGIFILMAVAIGITYAYFSAKIIGSETESTLVFDAGTLSINLDGGNTLNGDKMIPGDTPFSTKKFTVIGNNNSNGYMPYSVNLVVDENTYSIDAISYTLELVTEETDNNGEPIENRKNTPINYTDIIGSGYFTNGSNIKHTYLLKMYFLDTHTDQSADMRARFNAHIEITGNRASKNKVTVTFDADGGEIDTLSKEVVIGSAYGDLPIPTKEGYEFLGWNGKNYLNLNEFTTYSDNYKINNNSIIITRSSGYTFHVKKYVNPEKIPYGTYTLSSNIFGQFTNRIYGFFCEDSIYSKMIINNYYKRVCNISSYESDKFQLYILQNHTTKSLNINLLTDKLYIYNIMLEEGTEATEYEPYYIDKYTKVVQYENHTLKAIWKEIE